MIDSRKPRMPGSCWNPHRVRWSVGALGRDPEPNPVDFKIVEDWTEEFSDEPLINLHGRMFPREALEAIVAGSGGRFCPCAEANGWWSSDPSDWEVPMVAPKALPYLEEVNKGCWLKKNAHDGDFARWNSLRNACVVRERSDEEFYKGVPRGFKGAIQENIRFQQVLMFGQQYNISKKGRDRRCRKVKMNLVNKEY